MKSNSHNGCVGFRQAQPNLGQNQAFRHFVNQPRVLESVHWSVDQGGSMADFETEWEPFVIEFAGSLQDAERELRNLEGRYDQVCADWHQRQELRDRHDQTQAQLRREGRTAGDRRVELRHDLARLQTQIEELDQRLESRLLSESSLKDVFWQSVRFGGLGVAIGWALTRWLG